MPIMNGFEVTRRIRNSEINRINQVPIIALTADFTIEDKYECEVKGINDYLLKPFSPDDLLSKLVINRDKRSNQFNPSDLKPNAMDWEEDPNAIVDLRQAMDDCMGDLSVLSELVALFKLNALEFIGKVKSHLQNENFTEIRNAAHKIKCGLAMMHSHNLHFIVEQMHNNCRTTRDIEHLKKLYDCFVKKYPNVEKAMDKQLEILENKGYSKDD